jgi:mono/diheme cytochrome c family protein
MTLRTVDRGLALVSWLLVALVVVLLFAGPGLIGAKKAGTVAYGSGSSTSGAAVSGAAVFARSGCSGCHTLKAAGATGTIGPNLDQLRPSAASVSSFVSSGGGVMPSFSGRLSAAQIAAVAQYVATVAGH